MSGRTALADAAQVTLTVARYPYEASAIQVVREDVAKVLGDHPRTKDAELVLSELATNAVLHARRRGRRFEVEVESTHAYVRVAVSDGGMSRHEWREWQAREGLRAQPLDRPAPVEPADELAEGGRGLDIVGVLAQRRGACHEIGRTTHWAELASWMVYAENGMVSRTMTPLQAREFWDETPELRRHGDPGGAFSIWGEAAPDGGARVRTRFRPIPLELP